MNPLEAALRRSAADIDRLGYRWALVGGFAVSARSIPRFTQDIDLAVAVADDGAAEALVRSMFDAGYVMYASVEHDNGRLATIRLRRAFGGVPVLVDLLFASSGIEPEIVDAAEELAIVPEFTLPVATTGHLIALKILSRDDSARPQDLADLRELLAVATDDDVRSARTAVRLITERGFHRDRDLEASLDSLISKPTGT
ncbi:nucleotidyl transferase AbiEii/AbiGii toxin family protein [Nocardia puris]|uniref:Nucleotidyltransferase AbiEii toxin of type IV toxin-antitoxin system n=1 Tax=Nocardia puris TaxID=208602 RepID=A0A366E3H6_9NOCA|nr:nucleotidyl transferase AbiEii/AbiGii toxin family protein [Nocardia puris]MBF6215369.1 nucleotidyl transferase AbiEii/AbiGii toxin family protein [Nocardia puris]MBF6369777.1 nucleotidyl transferase AbiEii/AbiGii toxin family protein [Nocardia puris]MBF6463436.1 nucleotidyl transferase AbiEii/AbiGii toxin family protein [Nocardia puris]RBO96857.1 nucleotidyltransferase AbiEii toxin of type IV toxin-antitoxin system [Nocardia puris]